MQRVSCSVCTNPFTTRCSVCKLARYCGPECQHKDWAEHKDECKSPLDYDHMKMCNTIFVAISQSPQLQVELSAIFHDYNCNAICILVNNRYEGRMALRGRFSLGVLNDKTVKGIAKNIPPLCVTGYKKEREGVVVVSVKVPSDGSEENNSAKLAFAIPLKFS